VCKTRGAPAFMGLTNAAEKSPSLHRLNGAWRQAFEVGMYAPVLVEPPAADDPIITTAEAKLHCGIDSDEWDSLVDALVQAATTYLDGYAGILGRALVTQTWRQDFDAFCPRLRLPLIAATVTGIKAYAEDDDTGTTITVTNYELLEDALGSYVRFIDDYAFPSSVRETRGVRITFTAGYGAASAVPQAIKQAMLLMVGHWFANREAVNIGNITTELPLGARALLAPYRRTGV